MRSALERRQLILEALSNRRQDTYVNLAREMGVSKSTIRRDIEALSIEYPIYTIPGNAGGIRVADGYYFGRRYLKSSQEELLRQLLPGLQPEAQKTVMGILDAFAKPKIPDGRKRSRLR